MSKQVEKVETVKLECNPVEVKTFRGIVNEFVEKCSNKGAQAELRKTIVKYALGFCKENIFNSTIRMRNYSKTEITALKEQLSTATVISIIEAVSDMLLFSTSREDAIKTNFCDAEDLDFALSMVDIKTLDPKNCRFDMPEDVDATLLKLRIPETQKIETPSKLGQLIEEFLILQNFPTLNVNLRKSFSRYLMGQITEAELTKKLYNRETLYRRIIQYINTHYKAIQEGILGNKTEKSFKDDAEYVQSVLKA